MCVFGTKGDTGTQVLANSSNNFERNRTDTFFISEPDIGNMTNCRVCSTVFNCWSQLLRDLVFVWTACWARRRMVELHWNEVQVKCKCKARKARNASAKLHWNVSAEHELDGWSHLLWSTGASPATHPLTALCASTLSPNSESWLSTWPTCSTWSHPWFVLASALLPLKMQTKNNGPQEGTCYEPFST